MTNEELAEILLEIAAILEEQEENPYRIRASDASEQLLFHLYYVML